MTNEPIHGSRPGFSLVGDAEAMNSTIGNRNPDAPLPIGKDDNHRFNVPARSMTVPSPVEQSQPPSNTMYIIQEQRDKITKLENKLDKWKTKHRDQLEENEKLKRDAEKEMKSRQNAQEEAEEMRNQLQKQESSVTRAQTAALSLFSNTVSSVLPDDVIRRRFDGLFESLHDWARTNSLVDPKTKNIAGIKEILERNHLITGPDKWPKDKEFRFDFDNDTALDTLLNAAVTAEICRVVFCTPYFFAYTTHKIPAVSRSSNEKNSDVEFAARDLLASVQTGIENDDYAAAQEWRAQTVQTLSRGKTHQANLKKYCENVTDKFVDEYESLLADKKLKVSEREILLHIFHDFAKLAIEIWTQKMFVRARGLAYFEKENLRFSANSAEMKAAGAVKLDDHDTQLDGRPIPVVVQPLIEAFGNAEGKDYDKVKIWSKAVVWVSNKSGPRPKSHAGSYVTDNIVRKNDPRRH